MSDDNQKPKRWAYRHFIVEWGLAGVTKYTNKQKALKAVCELLQHSEESVAVYYIWNYESSEWSPQNRVNEIFLKVVTREDRLKYLTMSKIDLFG